MKEDIKEEDENTKRSLGKKDPSFGDLSLELAKLHVSHVPAYRRFHTFARNHGLQPSHNLLISIFAIRKCKYPVHDFRKQRFSNWYYCVTIQ